MSALHKLLYGFGFTQFGVRLLSELDPGSEEWFEFVDPLIDGKDMEARSLALDQLRDDGFYAEADQKDRIKGMALTYLMKGVGDEKRAALGFFVTNAGQFSKDDADVFSAVYAAARLTDPQVATPAEDLLKQWGFDPDALQSDKDLR